jgi:putative dimethyl sulfoxide reductase chaperone
MNTSPCRETNNALQYAGLYLLLAQAFAYPNAKTLGPVAGRWARLLKADNQWQEYLQQAVVEGYEQLRAADVETLAAEHHHLFGPAALCPLTETSWGDAARLLGKAAQIADIAGFYCAFNLRPQDKGNAVPEDHLLSELEFMSVLYLKEAYALYTGLTEPLEITREAQKKFLEEHLATWIDMWAESLRNYNPHPYYRALGVILQSLIHNEVERLGLNPMCIQTRTVDQEMGSDTFICPHAGTP